MLCWNSELGLRGLLTVVLRPLQIASGIWVSLIPCKNTLLVNMLAWWPPKRLMKWPVHIVLWFFSHWNKPQGGSLVSKPYIAACQQIFHFCLIWWLFNRTRLQRPWNLDFLFFLYFLQNTMHLIPVKDNLHEYACLVCTVFGLISEYAHA